MVKRPSTESVDASRVMRPQLTTPSRDSLVIADTTLPAKALARVLQQQKCGEFIRTKFFDSEPIGSDYIELALMLDTLDGIPPNLAKEGYRHQAEVERRLADHPAVVERINLDPHTTDITETKFLLNRITAAATNYLETDATDRRVWMVTELPLYGVIDGFPIKGAADTVLVIADPNRNLNPSDAPHLKIIVLDSKATNNPEVAHWVQPSIYAALLNAWFESHSTPFAVHPRPTDVTWEIVVSIADYDTLPEDGDSALASLDTKPNWQALSNKARALLGPDGIITHIWRDINNHDESVPTATEDLMSRTAGPHCTNCEYQESCMIGALAESDISIDIFYGVTESIRMALEEHDADTMRALAHLGPKHDTTPERVAE